MPAERAACSRTRMRLQAPRGNKHAPHVVIASVRAGGGGGRTWVVKVQQRGRVFNKEAFCRGADQVVRVGGAQEGRDVGQPVLVDRLLRRRHAACGRVASVRGSSEQ